MSKEGEKKTNWTQISDGAHFVQDEEAWKKWSTEEIKKINQIANGFVSCVVNTDRSTHVLVELEGETKEIEVSLERVKEACDQGVIKDDRPFLLFFNRAGL